MAEKFDAVIVGTEPGGEVVAGRPLAAGRKVAFVERELIGGECAYWACIPSKTLLRPPEGRGEADRAFGTGTPESSLEEVFNRRDFMIRSLGDSGQADKYESKDASVVRGESRLVPEISRLTGGGLRRRTSSSRPAPPPRCYPSKA